LEENTILRYPRYLKINLGLRVVSDEKQRSGREEICGRRWRQLKSSSSRKKNEIKKKSENSREDLSLSEISGRVGVFRFKVTKGQGKMMIGQSEGGKKSTC